ncbi:MAG: hypothetical protein HUJ65_02240, partial [Oscillospiraceae bacterium]|nr:hypothetical protein [Oscillospiraceae bacterium]
MKRLLEWHKNIGLRGKFASTLILSAILCTVFFFALNALCNLVLLRFVPGTPYETRYVSRKIDDLKEYVSDKNIGFDSLDRLKKWEKHEPLVLLELYDGNRCFYSSIGHA